MTDNTTFAPPPAMPASARPAARPPRLTPEMLAAAASVREYWASRATASSAIESASEGGKGRAAAPTRPAPA